MDVYKLSDYTPISIDSLIQIFQQGETIRFGSISIFGDSIGRPGDNIYTLNSITKAQNNMIEFEFKDVRITVHNPVSIVTNEKIIGIERASKIEWIEKKLHLIYEFNEDAIAISTVVGDHCSRVKSNRDALMIYSW